jgi:hypothetical protein
MSWFETVRQIVTPQTSYPMVTLFPGGPIGNDVGLNPAAAPDGGSVPEPQVEQVKSQISAVPLQVEQAQLDTWIDIGRLIVEVGKAL